MSDKGGVSGAGLVPTKMQTAVAESDAELAAKVKVMHEAMGIPTMMGAAEYTRKFAQVMRLFQGAAEQDVVDALIWFHSVYGTSPRTDWEECTGRIVVGSRQVHPKDYVPIIGDVMLKRFMARHGDRTEQMIRVSPEFQGALRSRMVAMGLPAGSEKFAVDYLGKDGKSTAATLATRNIARARALRGARGASALDAEAANMADDALEETVNLRGSPRQGHDPWL